MYWLCHCVASCYCVASCNRYLMLINHPTVGATRGLTLRVRLLGQIKKKKKKKCEQFFFPKNVDCSLIRSNTVYNK